MSAEVYCPKCFADVPAGAAACPNPDCAIVFVYCRQPGCRGLAEPDAKFCPDCGAPLRPEPVGVTSTAPAAPTRAAAAGPVAVAPPAVDPTVLTALLNTMPAVPPPVVAAPLAHPETAQPPASALATPVQLMAEYQTPNPMRKGRQAFLGVRVALFTAPGPLALRADVQSGLFTAPPAEVQVGVGVITPFAPARFIPATAGSDAARVTVTARTPAGAPLARWVGDVYLTVEDEDRRAVQITNTGGGSVTMFGAGAPPLPVPVVTLPPVWRPLPLAPDPGFAARLAACRKPPAVPAPRVPAAPPGQALVVVEDAGRRATLAVVRGPAATLGRGGKPGVAWWVRGEPLDRTAYLNLSGAHLSLAFRDDFAWAADGSKFGTKLNGAALTAAGEVLADGDVLDLAGAIRFAVGVAAEGDARAVWLTRTDLLAGRLGYAVVSGPVAVPVGPAAAPLGWVAWGTGAGGATILHYRPAGGTGWVAVSENQPARASATARVAWRAVAAPGTQDADLTPNPPILP